MSDKNTTELEKYLTPDIPRIFEKRHPSEIPQEELPIVLLQVPELWYGLNNGKYTAPLRVVLYGEGNPFGREIAVEECELSVDAMGQKQATWKHTTKFNARNLHAMYRAITGNDKSLTWTPGIDDQEPEVDPFNGDDDE